MPKSNPLAELISEVARETDTGQSLKKLAASVVAETHCRHAFIAVLNEETGEMEVRTYASPHRAFALQPNPDGGSMPTGIYPNVLKQRLPNLVGGGNFEALYCVTFADTASEFTFPVNDQNGRIRAIVNVESDRTDAITEVTKDLVATHGDLVSIILERESHHRKEEALIRVGAAISSVATEAALIEQVMEVAGDVLHLQACSIFLLNPTTDSFVLRGTSGRLREFLDQVSYRRGEGFTGWVCDNGQPILLDDPKDDPRWRGKYVEFPSDMVASFLAVPIISRGKSIGAIRAIRRKSDRPIYDNRFRTDDMRLLSSIAEQLAIGLESVQNTERTIRNERMVAWGELSAKSSHMIGNRVFALKGDLNELRFILDDELPSLVELRSLESSLSTNVRRIEEILQDFRDFVSATQLRPATTDLNALVQETVAEVFPRRSQVELVIELDPALPKAELDGKRLRRAVSELIENSLSHMDQGSLLVKTLLVRASENERTKNSKFQLFAEIVIADTGPGVALDRKNLIFQPFYTGRVRGMGLGLSIVKGIIDAHNGLVYETGNPGEGAKFVILLPLVP